MQDEPNPIELTPRAERLAISLSLTCRIVGTGIEYHLQMNNISKTGILVSSADLGSEVFDGHTLVEMTVPTFYSDIFFLGRVVRVTEMEKGVRFAVEIVRINSDNMLKWTKLVTKCQELQREFSLIDTLVA